MWREYRWISSDASGHVLSPILGTGEPIAESFSHEDLDEIAEKGELGHEPSYYEESRALTRLKTGEKSVVETSNSSTAANPSRPASKRSTNR